MRLQDGKRSLPGHSAWRFFPWLVAGAMSGVIAVNMFMAYAALHTFPGQAGRDGFDLSNRYDAVIESVRQQAALGWRINALADGAGRPVLVLMDANGTPLSGAKVEAVLERPLGDTRTTQVKFRDEGSGRYAGDVVLPVRGQWDIMLTASAQGHDVTTTRRIVVR